MLFLENRFDALRLLESSYFATHEQSIVLTKCSPCWWWLGFGGLVWPDAARLGVRCDVGRARVFRAGFSAGPEPLSG